jgi:diguanylate cyclase (GGDEF)-like protein
MTTPTPERTTRPAIDLYIAAIAVCALLAATVVVALEVRLRDASVNWALFVALAVLLVFTESLPSAVMRFGSDGMVTPSWAFAFALVLLGAPSAALAVMVAATMLADALARRPLRKLLFNSSQVLLSLALGAIAVDAFNVHGPLFPGGEIPLRNGLAMLAGGVVVFVTNSLVTGLLLSLLEQETFITIMRQGFVLSMSADGAMLALAPVLVVSLEASLLMLPLLATTAFLVFQTARQALQRAHEANHDSLTQLLNRRSFTEALDEHLAGPASTTAGALFVLDLDRFKEINDRLGHQTGDHVLQGFALRLTATLPPRAVVARLGGDEFAALLPNADAAEAMRAAEAVLKAFEAPMMIQDFPLSASTSIGVAIAPDHGASPAELLHAADVAMYRAKRYRSGVECYEAYGSGRERGRVTLLADIAEGVERNEFDVWYQPQVHIGSGRIECVEALLRWNHPHLGPIGPSEFIGLAEQTDLIEPLTKMVLEKAVADIATIDARTRVAVNISARNLQHRRFASDVIEMLAVSGFDAERLELEITESAVATEPERTLAALETLRTSGIAIAIDDFGTGYASFSLLRELPVDRLKIDRSFTAGIGSSHRDEQIVASIVAMAHRLGLTVVAEGVESESTWRSLARHGCDVTQGFLVSPPVPLDELAALMSREWRFDAVDEEPKMQRA